MTYDPSPLADTHSEPMAGNELTDPWGAPLRATEDLYISLGDAAVHLDARSRYGRLRAVAVLGAAGTAAWLLHRATGGLRLDLARVPLPVWLLIAIGTLAAIYLLWRDGAERGMSVSWLTGLATIERRWFGVPTRRWQCHVEDLLAFDIVEGDEEVRVLEETEGDLLGDLLALLFPGGLRVLGRRRRWVAGSRKAYALALMTRDQGPALGVATFDDHLVRKAAETLAEMAADG